MKRSGCPSKSDTTPPASATIRAPAKATVPAPSAHRARSPSRADATPGVPAAAALTCPEGTRLHGVGGEVSGGNGEVRLRHLDAEQSDTAIARAAEDPTGTDHMWSVRSFGICAK